jgi:hypothetical protein
VGDAFPAKIHILVGDVSGSVRFIEDLRAGAVPVDFAIGFLDTVAIAVVGVVHPATGFDFAFGIPYVRVSDIGFFISWRPTLAPSVQSKSAPVRKRRTRHP